MNNFCEECGNKLTIGDQFCDQCGLPITQTEDNTISNSEKPEQKPDITFSFFTTKKIDAKAEKDWYYGILLINSNKLTEKFNKQGAENIVKNLVAYTEYYKHFGIQYLILDTSDNHLKKVNGKNWKYHVNLLRMGIRKIHDKLNVRTHFLLIFGGDEFIPMPVLPNPNDGTSDVDVDTDLPYSTLSIDDPVKSTQARSPKICVGRFPTGSDTSSNDLITFMRNTQQAITGITNEKTFGLSANVWQEVSGMINSRVGKETLHISPGLTSQNLMQYYNPRINIHYFNLHGSNKSPDWFGQKGSNYPVAFTPDALQHSQVHNIVGVEACYGARFIGLSKNESILLTSLANTTVSFVGSSRIAFGPSTPPMSLADVVIHDFLTQIQQGVTAGEAFMKARINAFNKSVERSPAVSLLTLMEFNLFGDPVFFFSNKPKHNAKSIESDKEKVKLNISGSVDENPEEFDEHMLEKGSFKKENNNDEDSLYNRITRAVDESQRKITTLINKKVWDKYPEFKNIEPDFKKYSFQGKEFNSLTYAKTLEHFDKYLSVSTNNQGEILAEVNSK